MLTIGAVLSIGLFVSALSANQITAGVVTLIVAIMLMLVSMGTHIIRPTSELLRIARDVLGYVGILNHVEQFSRGVIDTRPLVYLLSVILLFLYGTIRAVESRRWR
jgi:ABC-2 type transport system permease protein